MGDFGTIREVVAQKQIFLMKCIYDHKSVNSILHVKQLIPPSGDSRCDTACSVDLDFSPDIRHAQSSSKCHPSNA